MSMFPARIMQVRGETAIMIPKIQNTEYRPFMMTFIN